MIVSLKLNLWNLNLKISNGEIFLETFPKLGLNSSYGYRTSKLPSISLLSNLLHSTVPGPSFPRGSALGTLSPPDPSQTPKLGLLHQSRSVSFPWTSDWTISSAPMSPTTAYVWSSSSKCPTPHWITPLDSPRVP